MFKRIISVALLVSVLYGCSSTPHENMISSKADIVNPQISQSAVSTENPPSSTNQETDNISINPDDYQVKNTAGDVVTEKELQRALVEIGENNSRWTNYEFDYDILPNEEEREEEAIAKADIVVDEWLDGREREDLSDAEIYEMGRLYSAVKDSCFTFEELLEMRKRGSFRLQELMSNLPELSWNKMEAEAIVDGFDFMIGKATDNYGIEYYHETKLFVMTLAHSEEEDNTSAVSFYYEPAIFSSDEVMGDMATVLETLLTHFGSAYDYKMIEAITKKAENAENPYYDRLYRFPDMGGGSCLTIRSDQFIIHPIAHWYDSSEDILERYPDRYPYEYPDWEYENEWIALHYSDQTSFEYIPEVHTGG